MSLKKNFLYNSVLTLSEYVLGLITFPYISRILGVSNIGIVSFVDNAIKYFILFASIGIGIIGAREIARYRGDSDSLQKVFSSLIAILLISTCIVVGVLILSIIFVPQINIYKDLFYIGIAKVVFSVFLIEWFYRGLENFRYITLRSLVIKVVFVLALFMFVKTRDDYKIYFALTTTVLVLNSIVNFLYSRRFVKISFVSLDLRKYLKESFSLGTYAILTSMYTTFNVVYLGWVTNTTQVGYYWAALKIYSIILGFFTAFTGVMMPRMSSLIAQENYVKFKELIQKSLNWLFTLCFPIIIGSEILAEHIINVLSGDEYSGAILPMRIIMVLILVVGLAQILAIQVLMPLKKDKWILRASIIGAIVGFCGNFLLVKNMGSVGTAIVVVVSEVSVTSFYVIVILKNRLVHFPMKLLLRNFIYSLPYILICYISISFFSSSLLIVLVAVASSLIYFVFVNVYVSKNSEILHLLKSSRKSNSLNNT